MRLRLTNNILEDLKMAAMLHAEAKNGNWSIMLDVFYAKLKETGTVVKEISVGSGITIVDVNGVFSIDSFDVTFGAGFYVYDIEVTSGSDIRTYVKGSLTVKQDVTYG